MSHLDDILNVPEILAVDTETQEDDMSSHNDDDDISLVSDDEIDELDDELDDEEDYGVSPPPKEEEDAEHPPHLADSLLEATSEDSKSNGVAARTPAKADEKRSKKPSAPRRKIERHDRRIDLGLHDHLAHDDCPDTLACLPDTTGRPQHTLPVILRCAILGSPRKRLTIREIYLAMEQKYPYYTTAGQTWKQSVRHHLSLNRLFERQPRPVTDPGFGSYWTVNLDAPPGTKRPRKRGRPNTKDSREGSAVKKAPMKNILPSPPVPPPQQTVFRGIDTTKFLFQPQSHPPPPPPPLPQPQVTSLAPRLPNHNHSTNLISKQQVSPPLPPPPPPPGHSRQYIGEPHHSPMRHHPHPHPHPTKPHHHHHSQPQQYHHGRPPPPPPPLLSHHAPPPMQHGSSHGSHSHSSSHSRPRYSHPHSSHSHPHAGPSNPYHHNHSRHDVEMERSYRLHSQRKTSTPTTGSDYPASSRGSDRDDNGMLTQSDNSAPFAIISEDDYESEEDMSRPAEHRPQHPPPRPLPAFVPTKPSPIFSLPPFSALDQQNREDVIEHMRQEIATLRRTSAEAVSTSLRLSEQLAHANLEVSRSREAVRDLEDMLQSESSRRKDAERQRESEAERRRLAENALGNLAVHTAPGPAPPPRIRP